ncbi:exosortase/archaeosortase family protein [Candidatus Woesebacteria bacterium]|nr:MAG: exosortase/archaeosortase family protein [Candidatus Woesebacteria bacterium]
MNKNNQLTKDTFKLLLVLLVIVLLILPFATAFNEFLTEVVENIGFYMVIQSTLVPYMSMLTAAILNILPGLEVGILPYGVVVNGIDVRITWNCLGWQSFLLFFASLFVGLRGNYSGSSKIQAVLFGLLGTFIINIFRLVFTAALVVWWRGLFVILFHNYFSTFIAILWLILYWWISYSYVLEEKDGEINK